MYSTCLFCSADLGKNESIEAFPVGRRLAYDAATGRLWVVCRRCGRWNLTPMEERWEAIEEAERLFRATRLRVSTDNIGLARLRDGSELVRVGKPERPELAAWRYERSLAVRRRRHAVDAVAATVASAGLLAGVPIVGAAIVGALGPLGFLGALTVTMAYRSHRRAGLVHVPGERHRLLVRTADLKHALLVDDGRDWGLTLTGSLARDDAEWWQLGHRRVERTLHGDAARWAAAALLPRVNASLGSGHDVHDAVELLGRATDPLGVFAEAARDMRWRFRHGPPVTSEMQHLERLPRGVRLALEMAAHEETERRAMEGELAELERAWRDADELAHIADDLLLPAGVAATLDRMRRTRDRA